MPSPTERAATLLGDFERDDASVISVLCDRHAEDAVAFTLVDEDMSTTDVTIGELRASSTRFAAGLSSLGVTRTSHASGAPSHDPRPSSCRTPSGRALPVTLTSSSPRPRRSSATTSPLDATTRTSFPCTLSPSPPTRRATTTPSSAPWLIASRWALPFRRALDDAVVGALVHGLEGPAGRAGPPRS
jgi:hypothetical protein